MGIGHRVWRIEDDHEIREFKRGWSSSGMIAVGVSSDDGVQKTFMGILKWIMYGLVAWYRDFWKKVLGF